MPLFKSNTPGPHYGWFIIAAGTLGIFGCLGLGRFALGMLLPTMGTALNLSYQQMGMLSTANFCGYLAGILFAAKVTVQFGARIAATGGLLIAGLSMFAIALSNSLVTIMPFYCLTGIGSALANIALMALVGTWFSRTMRGKAAGFMVTGSGYAIIFSGLAIPMIDQISQNNWRYSWLVLAVLVSVIAGAAYAFLRNTPKDMGISKLTGDTCRPSVSHTPKKNTELSLNLVLHCGILYAVFGFTFVSFATFIVTTMIRDYGISQDTAGKFWSWIGLFSLLSGPMAGYFSDRFNRKYTLAFIYFIQSTAFLLVGLGSTRLTLLLAICLFGLVAWSIPSTMAALCSDYAGPEKAVSMFSSITLVFALGQITGPYITGLVAQLTGNFSTGYILASLLAGAAVLLSFFLPPPHSDN